MLESVLGHKDKSGLNLSIEIRSWIPVHLDASQNKPPWYYTVAGVQPAPKALIYHLTFLDLHLLIYKNGGLYQHECFKFYSR